MIFVFNPYYKFRFEYNGYVILMDFDKMLSESFIRDLDYMVISMTVNSLIIRHKTII